MKEAAGQCPDSRLGESQLEQIRSTISSISLCIHLKEEVKKMEDLAPGNNDASLGVSARRPFWWDCVRGYPCSRGGGDLARGYVTLTCSRSSGDLARGYVTLMHRTMALR